MSDRRFVALLRGINVGGRSRVAMDALRASFSGAGYQNVATYIQSGNVVFDAPEGAPEADDLAGRLYADLGTPVTVVVRSAGDLARIAADNPFLGRAAAPSALHVTFLAAAPDPQLGVALTAPAGEPADFRLLDEEVYLHCPQGYGQTKLTNAYFERRLGVEATTRNWNTVLKLRDLAGAGSAPR